MQSTSWKWSALVLAVLVLAVLVLGIGPFGNADDEPTKDRKRVLDGPQGSKATDQQNAEQNAERRSDKKVPRRGSDDGTAAKGGGQPQWSDRKADRMIQFGQLVCGETRTISKDGTITVHEIMCDPPTESGGNTPSTDEKGDDSEKDGDGKSDDKGSGGGNSNQGSSNQQRGPKPGQKWKWPREFHFVPVDVDTADATADSGDVGKKPRRDGGSKARGEGFYSDPEQGNPDGDTKFGPRVLSAKGGSSSDRGKWGYLGSYEDDDGSRVEIWGDPNSSLGGAWGCVDGKPPKDLDKPKTKPNGKPKRTPKKDKPDK